MVASDTVVGLVGAGILLVALIGVFIVESRDTDTDVSMESVEYDFRLDGNIHSWPQTGAAPVAGCIPPACSPAGTDANLTLTGLPLVERAFYVVFTGPASGQMERLGVLEPAGGGGGANTTHRMPRIQTQEDRSDHESFAVSLETSAQATTPSGLPIYSQDIGSLSDGPIIMVASNTSLASGTARATLRNLNSGVEGDAFLDGATNHTGFTYRAWFYRALPDGQGDNYTFLGDFAGDDNATSVRLGVPGLNLDDFEQLIITIEPASGSRDRPGFRVFTAGV